jgi:hypothetical protein
MITKDGVYYVQAIEEPTITGVLKSHGQPIYLLGAWAIHRKFGLDPQTAGHLLNLTFSMGCLALIYFFGLQVSGSGVAVLSALLYALHPEIVQLDTDVSNVSCAIFWTTLALYALWQALKSGNLPAVVAAPLLAITAILSRREAAILVLIFAGFPTIQFVMSAIPRYRHLLLPSLRFILGAGAVTAIGVFLAFALDSGLGNRLENASRMGQAFFDHSIQPKLLGPGLWITLSDGISALQWFVLPLFILGILFRRRLTTETLFTLLSLTFVAAIFFMNLTRAVTIHPDFVTSRYFALALPFGILFAAFGLAWLRMDVTRRWRWSFSLAIALVIFPALFIDVYPPHLAERPYREGRIISGRPMDRGERLSRLEVRLPIMPVANIVNCPSDPN